MLGGSKRQQHGLGLAGMQDALQHPGAGSTARCFPTGRRELCPAPAALSVSASTSSPLEGIAAAPQTTHPSLLSHLSLASGCDELLGAAATHLQSPAGPSDCSRQICGHARNQAGKLIWMEKKGKKPHDPVSCMNTHASTGEGVGTRRSAAAWLVP